MNATEYDQELFELQVEFTNTVKNAKVIDPRFGQEIENLACELLFATKGSIVATLGIYNLTGNGIALKQIPLFFSTARSEFIEKVIRRFDIRHLEKCLKASASLDANS